jgi:hypothetical protein
MAFIINDRVKETTTTTGTGAITFGGAVQGYETFAAGIGNSNTTYYAIYNPGTTEFEVGLGTLSADSSTMARTTIISSSNSDNAVNFSAGTKDIFCTLPASKAIVKDDSDDVKLGDDEKLIFGAGSDLQIYHDTTANHSYISESGSGDLIITGGNIRLENGSNEYYIRTYNNGKVELYYDNSKKLETASTGVDVTGNVSASAVNITNTSTDDSLLITTTEDSNTAAPVITLKRNSASPANGDYLGQLKFKGENDADQEVVYAKITGKISDDTDTTEDGLIEFALRKDGSNNIGARLTSTDLKLINGTGFEVGGYSFPTSDGTSTQILQTDGAGTLTFVDKPTGGASNGFVIAMAVAL